MRTRQETDIKIVASMGDVAASGGYYIACAAYHIMANPATITGSIGIIVSTQNISSLLDKIGVRVGNIKSGQYKDILSPYDDLSEGERAIVEQIVNQSYQQFLDAIVASREIPLEELQPLSDGRIFTGEQAQQENLVDSLGNSYDALQKVAELAKIEGEPKIRNYTTPSLQDSLGDIFSASWQQLIPIIQRSYLSNWKQIQFNLMME
jgi:protease-4